MIIDHIRNAHIYTHVSIQISKAFDFIKNTNLAELELGRYDIDGDAIFALVQEYDTKDATDCQMESHFKHIDLQYIITGQERMGLATKGKQKTSIQDIENDYALYHGTPSFVLFEQGMFGIYFPDDLHMPCIQIDEPLYVKKVVIKIRV